MLKTKFSREITVILLVKFALVYGFWSMCFKDSKIKLKADSFAEKVYGEHDKDAQ